MSMCWQVTVNMQPEERLVGNYTTVAVWNCVLITIWTYLKEHKREVFSVFSCFVGDEVSAHCTNTHTHTQAYQNLNLTGEFIVIRQQEAASSCLGGDQGVKGRCWEFLTCCCFSAHFALPSPGTTTLLLLPLLLLLLCVVVFRSECLAAG